MTKPRNPPAEPAKNAEWSKLDSSFALRLDQLFRAMAEQGLECVMIEGLRSKERARWLWGWGRKWGVPGRFRTKRDPASLEGHRIGMAADVWEIDDGRVVCPPPADLFWRTLGGEAKRLGLVWGGDWKSLNDLAHVEMKLKREES
jgi:peptidoglycan L-alanyl-D-glutamate endopeptidase CwlK